MSFRKWAVPTAGAVTLLYLVWRLLKLWLHRRQGSPRALAWEYARSNSDEPTHLVLLVNGFLGGQASGRHVVDVVLERAGSRPVAAVRVQASDLFSGVNVYSGGVGPASDEVVACVRRLQRRWPSLERVSLLGSSFGGLVQRAAAPQVEALGLRLDSLVCMCSPHSGAAQAQRWAALVALQPLAILHELLAASHGGGPLAQLGGAEARFRRRIAVGSPHDTTVPLENALLGFALPAAELRAAPLSAESQLLLQRQGRPDEPESAGAGGGCAIARRLRAAGPWTLLVTSGRHSDETRAFSSRAVWAHIADLILE